MKEHFITPSGNEVYTLNDKHHRPNGPAIIWEDKTWNWALNHLCHRYYGPDSDEGHWTIHGVQIK